MISRFLIILAFISSISLSHDKPNLIGIWQNLPFMGSGWGDNFQFFDNGTYKFNFNQMVCDNRTISVLGDWSIEKNGNLKLTVKQDIIIEGGKLIKATGSCASDFEIEGGEIKTISHVPLETKFIKLTDFIIDKENNNLESLKFDGTQLWRIEKDPQNYH